MKILVLALGALFLAACEFDPNGVPSDQAPPQLGSPPISTLDAGQHDASPIPGTPPTTDAGLVGRPLLSACSADPECSSHMCRPIDGETRCTQVCRDNRDCPGPGGECDKGLHFCVMK